MGHGIAQISAVNGYQVVAVESSEEALDKGMARISSSLDKMLKKEASKGIITEVSHPDAIYYSPILSAVRCGNPRLKSRTRRRRSGTVSTPPPTCPTPTSVTSSLRCASYPRIISSFILSYIL